MPSLVGDGDGGEECRGHMDQADPKGEISTVALRELPLDVMLDMWMAISVVYRKK